jgi:hypothetical protein
MEELSVPNAGLVDKLLALGPGYSAARAARFHLGSHQGLACSNCWTFSFSY